MASPGSNRTTLTQEQFVAVAVPLPPSSTVSPKAHYSASCSLISLIRHPFQISRHHCLNFHHFADDTLLYSVPPEVCKELIIWTFFFKIKTPPNCLTWCLAFNLNLFLCVRLRGLVCAAGFVFSSCYYCSSSSSSF